jgi:hypothetical protein
MLNALPVLKFWLLVFRQHAAVLRYLFLIESNSVEGVRN